MRSQFLKVSALALASALFTPFTLPRRSRPKSKHHRRPTPQEVAAENLDQLLELVERGQARASAENQRANSVSLRQSESSQGTEAAERSVCGKSVALRA